MNLNRKIILCGVAALLSGTTWADWTVARTEDGPKIDGALNDACWRTATLVDRFYPIGRTESDQRGNRAWLTADERFLYVAFDVKQRVDERLNPQYTGIHDDFVQRDDCVKVSFDPAGNGRTWYHFKLNRANVHQDRRYQNGTAEINHWNIPWYSAVQERADGWSVEIALPLSLLQPFDKLEHARINLLITNNIAQLDPQGVAVKTPEHLELSAAELQKGFNEPENFLPVKGLEKIAISAPFLPFVSDVRIGNYRKTADGFSYPVIFKLKSHSFRGGSVAYCINDQPEGGNAVSINGTLDIPNGTGEREYSIDIPVENLAARSAEVIFSCDTAGVGGSQRFSLTGQAMEALNLFDAFAGQNYYTDEPDAVAVCSIKLPPEMLKNLKLQAFAGQKMLCEQPISASTERLRIPLDSLQTEENKVTLKLVADSRMISAFVISIVKKAAGNTREVKIDRERRVMLVDGKPFFPFALSYQYFETDPAEMERLVKLGFNTLLLWYEAGYPDSYKAIFDNYSQAANAAGLNLIVGLDRYSDVPSKLVEKYLPGKNVKLRSSLILTKSALVVNPQLRQLPREVRTAIYDEYFQQVLPKHLEMLDTLKAHKNIISWFIMDEPHGTFDQYHIGRKFFSEVNSHDGYRPVFINYSSNIPAGTQWHDWCDIICTDPYFDAALGNRPGVEFVAQIASETDRRAAMLRQPSFSMPMASYWSASLKRTITDAEQRAQTYLAAINGAVGIIYYTNFTIINESLWNTLGELGSEFKILGPACVEARVAQEQQYTLNGQPANCAPNRKEFVPVQVALKKDPRGGYILMAANGKPYPVAVNIRMEGLTGEVHDCFGDAVYPVSDTGGFTDHFEGHGTRAYKIAATLPPGPVKIKIDQQATPTAPEQYYPDGVRPGKKNILCNPSFEDASVPFIPDYYRTSMARITPAGSFAGGATPRWGLDDSTAKFGRRSMKIQTLDKPDAACGFLMWRRLPTNKQAREYTFSVWLKADRPNTKVIVDITSFSVRNKTFTVGTDWSRHHFTGVLPGDTGIYPISRIELATPGTLWIDGMQLEAGNTLTEFEE